MSSRDYFGALQSGVSEGRTEAKPTVQELQTYATGTARLDLRQQAQQQQQNLGGSDDGNASRNVFNLFSGPPAPTSLTLGQQALSAAQPGPYTQNPFSQHQHYSHQNSPANMIQFQFSQQNCPPQIIPQNHSLLLNYQSQQTLPNFAAASHSSQSSYQSQPVAQNLAPMSHANSLPSTYQLLQPPQLFALPSNSNSSHFGFERQRSLEDFVLSSHNHQPSVPSLTSLQQNAPLQSSVPQNCMQQDWVQQMQRQVLEKQLSQQQLNAQQLNAQQLSQHQLSAQRLNQQQLQSTAQNAASSVPPIGPLAAAAAAPGAQQTAMMFAQAIGTVFLQQFLQPSANSEAPTLPSGLDALQHIVPVTGVVGQQNQSVSSPVSVTGRGPTQLDQPVELRVSLETARQKSSVSLIQQLVLVMENVRRISPLTPANLLTVKKLELLGLLEQLLQADAVPDDDVTQRFIEHMGKNLIGPLSAPATMTPMTVIDRMTDRSSSSHLAANPSIKIETKPDDSALITRQPSDRSRSANKARRGNGRGKGATRRQQAWVRESQISPNAALFIHDSFSAQCSVSADASDASGDRDDADDTSVAASWDTSKQKVLKTGKIVSSGSTKLVPRKIRSSKSNFAERIKSSLGTLKENKLDSSAKKRNIVLSKSNEDKSDLNSKAREQHSTEVPGRSSSKDKTELIVEIPNAQDAVRSKRKGNISENAISKTLHTKGKANISQASIQKTSSVPEKDISHVRPAKSTSNTPRLMTNDTKINSKSMISGQSTNAQVLKRKAKERTINNTESSKSVKLSKRHKVTEPSETLMSCEEEDGVVKLWSSRNLRQRHGPVRYHEPDENEDSDTDAQNDDDSDVENTANRDRSSTKHVSCVSRSTELDHKLAKAEIKRGSGRQAVETMKASAVKLQIESNKINSKSSSVAVVQERSVDKVGKSGRSRTQVASNSSEPEEHSENEVPDAPCVILSKGKGGQGVAPKIVTNEHLSVEPVVVIESPWLFEDSPSLTDSPALDITLLKNINMNYRPALRYLYMGQPLAADNVEWLTFVGCSNPDFLCQCIFCPALQNSAHLISKHLLNEHAELVFSLVPVKRSISQSLFLSCRHCDFVAIDANLMFIHFESYHGVQGILERSMDNKIDLSTVVVVEGTSLDDLVSTAIAYLCFDCSAISDNQYKLSLHVLQQHPHTSNYNGCFVKLLQLLRPDFDETRYTFGQLTYDKELATHRKEVYICMLCEYSAYCPYLALSHSLAVHQPKRLLRCCSQCRYNCFTDVEITRHLKAVHQTGLLICSTTVLEGIDGTYHECPPVANCTRPVDHSVLNLETLDFVPDVEALSDEVTDDPHTAAVTLDPITNTTNVAAVVTVISSNPSDVCHNEKALIASTQSPMDVDSTAAITSYDKPFGSVNDDDPDDKVRLGDSDSATSVESDCEHLTDDSRSCVESASAIGENVDSLRDKEDLSSLDSKGISTEDDRSGLIQQPQSLTSDNVEDTINEAALKKDLAAQEHVLSELQSVEVSSSRAQHAL